MNDKELAEIKRIKGILSAVTGLEDDDQEYIEDARKALQSIISQDALDKMAESARELGLDHEPAPVQEPKFVRMIDGVPCIPLEEHKHLMATQPAAQPAVQEPVAWISPNGSIHFDPWLDSVPLYTTAAQPAAPLTDRDLASACLSYRHDFGLMDETNRGLLMFQAREWARAFGLSTAAAPEKGGAA
jgi:hypothetical protein